LITTFIYFSYIFFHFLWSWNMFRIYFFISNPTLCKDLIFWLIIQPTISLYVATPLWGKCKDETHIPKSGNLESSRTPETLELNCRGQNTSRWGVLYTVEKVLKWKCRKWPRISHSDICSTSYGWKKGRESNWQFDSRPLKFGNQPDPDVWRWSATHPWKALEESYKFVLDLIPIRGLSWELWTLKVPGV